MGVDYLQLKDKRFIISGVANERSIAWAVAEALHAGGAQLAFLYAERMEKWVAKLVDPLAGSFKVPFDGGDDASMDAAFDAISKRWDTVDGMLHSIAFASPQALGKDFIDCAREDFLLAQNISTYSLIAMCRRVRPLMPAGGSIIALSFIGSTRAMGQYHVMGTAKASLECAARYLARDLGASNIRINILSPGPIRTLSAKGVAGFSELTEHYYARCPLPDPVIDTTDVADAALYLFSDRAKKITGGIHFVDSGYYMQGT